MLTRTKHQLIAAVMAIPCCWGCGTPPPPSGQEPDRHTAAVKTHCYLQVTQHPPFVVDADTFPSTPDSLYIRLDLLGELANGVYNWLPGEKDSKTGSFTGSFENGIVTALYTYTAEGMTAKEEVLFQLEGNGLRIGTGELVESEGVWLFKDRSLAVYGNPLPEVPCW